MVLKNKIITDSILHIMGNAISKVLVILINLHFASKLGTSEFGSYSYVQNSILTIAGIGLVGLTSAITYMFATKSRAESISTMLVLLVYINIIGMIVALGLSLFNCLNIVFFCVLSVINYGVISGAFYGSKFFKHLSAINVLSSLCFVLFVYFDKIADHHSAILLFTIYKVILFLCSSVVLTKLYWDDIKGSNTLFSLKGKGIKDVFSFAIPMAISSFFVGPVMWFGNDYLYKINEGAQSLGLYSFGYQIYMALIFIPSILSSLYFSYLTNGNKNLIKWGLSFNFVVTLFLCLITDLFLDTYLLHMGNEYFQVKGFILFFYITAIVYSVSSIIGQKILAEKKIWLSALFNAIWAITFIGLVLFLVPSGGAYSLALALLLSYVMQLISQLFYFKFKL